MTNRELVNIFAYECSKNTTDFYKRGNSMHICNNRLYSYATCIAEYTQEGLIINDTRYSKPRHVISPTSAFSSTNTPSTTPTTCQEELTI